MRMIGDGTILEGWWWFILYAIGISVITFLSVAVAENKRIDRLVMTPIENYISLNEEIAIRDSYIEDLCSAVDKDEANFRTSCEDIIKANDRGRGL